jgi:hypothetical protein
MDPAGLAEIAQKSRTDVHAEVEAAVAASVAAFKDIFIPVDPTDEFDQILDAEVARAGISNVY